MISVPCERVLTGVAGVHYAHQYCVTVYSQTKVLLDLRGILLSESETRLG